MPDRVNARDRWFGLIGYPLSHSFSGKYFAEKFEREGIHDCRYELFPLSSIEELPRLIEDHPQLEGINVTIPYKQSVIAYLSSRSHLEPGLDACNCIRVEGENLIGYNTDLFGFENSLRPLLKDYHQKALVLGNGGATAAIIFVLKKLGIAFDIVSRRLHGNSTLTYEDIDENQMRSSLLIINTTPVGMYPNVNESPEIPYESLTPRHLLYDLVYNPAETVFLQRGKAKGATIKNGAEMLILQAEESWRIWNSGE